ncbi:MAG TPA: alpha/beta fold hydrolase [Chitinophagaceae bacterium]
MHAAVFPYQSSHFQFLHFGRGPQVVVCLHGYGESARSFIFLEKYLGGDYTFFAINLPYHEGTRWKERHAFTAGHLLEVIQAIFREAGIAPATFVLLGYSMGGRVAMTLADRYPEKVARLCLIAPDGLKMNFWYWLSTQTSMGNALFRFTMRHPAWFMGLVKGAHRLHLINTSIGKFLSSYIGDPIVRQELYDRWTCMRKFTPRLSRLQQHIRSRPIPMQMVFGKYDRIIVATRGEQFAKATGEKCRMIVLSAGHQLLQEKYASTIVAMIQGKPLPI